MPEYDQFKMAQMGPYTADHTITDQGIVSVDTSGGPVAITLADSIVEAGSVVIVHDVGGSASTHAITVKSGSSANINPGGASSKDITVDDSYIKFWSGGTNWNSDLNKQIGVFEAEEGPNKVLNASPGEVQSKIDTVASSGEFGKVMLESQTEYDPSSTWRVKQDVILDFNGAKLKPTTDMDLMEIEISGVVDHAIVDLGGLKSGYTSNVFTLDPSFTSGGRYFGEHPIRNGQIYGSGGVTGTALYFRIIGTTNGSIGVCRFDLDVSTNNSLEEQSIGTYADVHLESPNGYINGNILHGVIRGAGTFVHHRGTQNPIRRNEYRLNAEPSPNANAGWLMERGEWNVFHGHMWDQGRFSQNGWVIGANAQGHNVVMQRGVAETLVTDNAGIATNMYSQEGGVPNSVVTDGPIIGFRATATASGAIAMGRNSTASDSDTIAVGEGSSASSGQYTEAFGVSALATGGSTVIGGNAKGQNNNSVVVGKNASTSGALAVAVGEGSVAAHESAALGEGAAASGVAGIAIGKSATASSVGSMAVGRNVTSAVANLARVGVVSDSDAPHQTAIAAANGGVASNAQMNNQEILWEPDETNTQLLIKYKDSSGTVHSAAVIPSGSW